MTDSVTGDTWRSRSPAPLVHVPPAAAPAISFVFVTYGTGTVVITAIASLVDSLVDSDLDLDLEIVVVDNEHPTRPHRTCNHLLLDTAGVRVVRPGRNLGFAGGCNAGVRLTSAATIGLVNPDVEFAPGWIEPLLAALDDGVGIAAPVLREPDGSVQSAGHRLFADGSTAPIVVAPGPGEVDRPDYASAACWLMRRATFDSVGGFDEAFFPAYYEDVDLAVRVRSHGGTAVVGDSSVVHHRGGSTDSADIPDTTPQRLRLLDNWPSLESTQPVPPTRSA